MPKKKINKTKALRLAQSFRAKASAKLQHAKAPTQRVMIDFVLMSPEMGGTDQVNLMIPFDQIPEIIRLLQSQKEEDGKMLRLGMPGLVVNVQHDDLIQGQGPEPEENQPANSSIEDTQLKHAPQ